MNNSIRSNSWQYFLENMPIPWPEAEMPRPLSHPRPSRDHRQPLKPSPAGVDGPLRDSNAMVAIPGVTRDLSTGCSPGCRSPPTDTGMW